MSYGPVYITGSVTDVFLINVNGLGLGLALGLGLGLQIIVHKACRKEGPSV